MKTLLSYILLTFLILPLSYAQVSEVSEKKVAGNISAADFEGEWHGEEKCQNISAPVAKIIITPQGSEEVMISGLYSTVGPVIGTVKNNVITIPKQVVPDPIFKNLKIQGTLTLSKNRKSLQALFIIFNNDARDDCGASYHR